MMRVPTKQRRSAGGFTMVELLIAMVAGLVVVLSAVALGRDATTNFHQEMRIAGTQMTQRLSAQRLRSDIERTGFMSTGNMLQDPRIAHCLHGSSGVCTGPDTIGTAPTYIDTTTETGLATLMSVRLKIAGSMAGNVATYSTLNGLTPDAIELSGNFTTADEFTASIDQPGSACAGGARIYLEPKDPAVIRLLYPRSGVYDAVAAQAALIAAFAPVYDAANFKAPAFGIRVSDSSGTHYQFATICGAANAIGITTMPVPGGGTLPRPYIDTSHALMTQDLGIGGITPGQGAGSNVVVNPVQVVRWEITQRSQFGDATTSNRGKLLDTPNIEALQTARFELIRTWVPFDTAPFANVATKCPDCLELVSEFPIDLKFGFSTLTPAGVLTSYNLTDGSSPKTPNTIAPDTGTATPQQIRSITFRLGTRAAMSDRAVTIPAVNPHFLFRYQISTTTNEVARARETMEEVFLPNQASMNY